jgi:hypothetical protein
MTMIAVDARALLRVWEEQQRAHPVQRALHLLAHAWPEHGEGGWLHAPIGTRDAALMRLHESLFGGALHTRTACPHCGERVELPFSVGDVLAGAAAQPDTPRLLSLVQHGHAIDYRLPTSDDLLAGDAMAQHDPDADVRITLACPACGDRSQAHFDIVSYLWSELDDWAQRVLADVHVLARAYGWSEDAILALSPSRRQIYLEMASA